MRYSIDFTFESNVQSMAIEIATMVTSNSILCVADAVEDHECNTSISANMISQDINRLDPCL